MATGSRGIKIDLNLTHVPQDSKVWCVHSGKSKKVLERFVNHEIIALDLPGLRLSQKALEDDDLLTKHILMSEKTQEYYKKLKSQKPNDPSPMRPSLNPSDYELPETYRDKSRLAYRRRNIQRFISEITRGDVVVTPSHSAYKPFLFGFVKSNPLDLSTRTIADYPRDPVLAVSVEWFPHETTKRDLAPALARMFEKQEVVTYIDRKAYGHDLFTSVLGAYYDDKHFGVDIRCPRFRGKNPLETIPVQELITAVTAIIAAGEELGIDGFSNLGYDELINEYYDEDLIINLSNEFNSPGFYRTISRRVAVGLLLLSIIPICSSSALDPATLDNVELEGASPEQKKEFDETIKPLLKHLKPETRKELVNQTKKAQRELAARTNAVARR